MQRKQLKRGVQGWRMLPNSRSVARPSRWGNQFIVEDGGFNRGFVVVRYGRYSPMLGKRLRTVWQALDDRYWTEEQATQKAVELYREYAIERLKREPDWLDPLRYLDNLYCWCEEDAPWCHGDVLIELVRGQ